MNVSDLRPCPAERYVEAIRDNNLARACPPRLAGVVVIELRTTFA